MGYAAVNLKLFYEVEIYVLSNLDGHQHALNEYMGRELFMFCLVSKSYILFNLVNCTAVNCTQLCTNYHPITTVQYRRILYGYVVGMVRCDWPFTVGYILIFGQTQTRSLGTCASNMKQLIYI